MADFEKVYSVKFNVDAAIKKVTELDRVVDKLEKNNVSKALANAEKRVKSLGVASTLAAKNIKTISMSGKNLGKLSQSFDSLDKSMGRIEKNRLSSKLGNVTNKMKSMRQESSKTGRALDRAFAKNRATKKIDNLKRSADKAARSVRSIGNSGANLRAFSQNVTRYAVLPLAALGAASIKTAMDLNKSMASVSTLLENPIGKIDQLKKSVQDLAIETGQATDDLSGGLYQVISALGESSDNLGQLKIASNAAVAGVSSTKDAINLLSAAGKGYNDTSKEALQHTSDLAFLTAKLGVTTFPEMAASMGKVIPLAAQFGTTQEELFATMATLTGVTGNTAEVTTQLSSVYSAFMKPSGAMDDALQLINQSSKEYNFQTAGAMLKSLGFKKSIELMNTAADGNEEALGKIFKRKEAILGVLPLISTQSENYAEKLKAMQDASGATSEAFDRQTKGINAQGFEWEKTKQRMVVFSQRIGDRLLPVLGRMLDFAEPIIKWLETMDDESVDAAISWGKLVVQLGLGLKVLQLMTTTMSGIAGGISGIGAAAGGATGAVGGMAGAVGKLNVALGALAVGLAVGGVIWTAIDNAEKKNVADQNKKTMGTKDAAAIIADENSTAEELQGAMDFIANKHKGVGKNDTGEKFLSGVEASIKRGTKVNYSDEVKGDISLLNEARAKRKSILKSYDKRGAAHTRSFGAATQSFDGYDEFEGLRSSGGGYDASLKKGVAPSSGSGYDPWSAPGMGTTKQTGESSKVVNVTTHNTINAPGASRADIQSVYDKAEKKQIRKLENAIAGE